MLRSFADKGRYPVLGFSPRVETGRGYAELISDVKAFFAGKAGLGMAFKAALLDRVFLLLLGLPAAVFLRVLCPSLACSCAWPL